MSSDFRMVRMQNQYNIVKLKNKIKFKKNNKKYDR